MYEGFEEYDRSFECLILEENKGRIVGRQAQRTESELSILLQ